jgi:PAS domain S-box-containing protein
VFQEQRTRESLYALLQQAPVPIAIVRGEDLRFEFANSAYHHMVSRAELVGRDYCDVFPEARRDGADLRMLAVMRDGVPYHIPEVRRTYDRLGNGVEEEAYFSVSYTPLQETGESVSRLIISAIELTDQVRAKLTLQAALKERDAALQRLANSERRLQGIIDAAPTTIFTMTPDGKLSFASRSFAVFTGVDSEALLGESWQFANIVHPDDLPLVFASRESSFASTSPFEIQIRLRRADGEYRWHLTRVVPSFDESGTLVEWLGTSTEIGEQKRIETELNEKQTVLENALQAKDEFLSLVSHELRSPLTVIMGYSRLLARSNDLSPEEQQEWAREMFSQSRRLNTIIENLLSMARYDGEDASIELEVVLPQQVLASVLNDLRLTIDRQIHIESAEEGAPAWANTFCLEQILRNLISNAIKYSPAGAPIEISFAEAEDGVLIAVTDHGPGIDSAEATKVFEPFYRSPSTASTAGVGIGLTVCQRLAAAMGARVALAETSTEGSTFTLWLPSAEEA